MSSQHDRLINFLNILADNTRLEILEFLQERERNSAEIQERLDKSQSTISQHLKVLRDANLVDFVKKENMNYYFIKNQDIFKLLTVLKTFLDDTEKTMLWKESKRDLEDLLL